MAPLFNAEVSNADITSSVHRVRLPDLHWAHWALLALGLCLTLVFYRSALNDRDARYRDIFERNTDLVVEQFLEQLQRYEDVLWAGVGAIHARTSPITRGQWRKFTESLQLEERYPAIKALAIVASVDTADLPDFLEQQRLRDPDFTIFPEGEDSLRLPIVQIEPRTPNRAAIGLDGAQDPSRRYASLRARDSGQAHLTGALELRRAADAAGLVLYVPLYEKAGVPEPTKRIDQFRGLVAAPIVIQDMLGGSLRKHRRQVWLSVTDEGRMLYDEHDASSGNHDADPLYTRQVELEALGRVWSMDFRSTRLFRERAASSESTTILGSGLAIVALMLVLFSAQARARRHSVRHVEQLSGIRDELAQKASALEHSNAELERFAYVVAHDLKAPLNGIHMVTDSLKDDLDELELPVDSRPDVDRSIGMLQQQVVRMRALIDGIMHHAQATADEERIEHIDLNELVAQIATNLALPTHRLIRPAPLPFVDGHRIPLQQVLENLIGNAVKYHPVPGRATVRITAERTGAFYRIAVEDNGPGIEPARRSTIFDLFDTGGSTGADSTGVGLSIVKRAVESRGGAVHVGDAEGGGARFVFTWPASLFDQDAPPLARAA